MRRITSAIAPAAALFALVLLSGPAASAQEEEPTREECVMGCRDQLRDCRFDAREASRQCRQDGDCGELRDAYRDACLADDRVEEECDAARDALRDCIIPCRDARRDTLRVCRADGRSCLDEDCSIERPRPRRPHPHRRPHPRPHRPRRPHR